MVIFSHFGSILGHFLVCTRDFEEKCKNYAKNDLFSEIFAQKMYFIENFMILKRKKWIFLAKNGHFRLEFYAVFVLQ